MEAKLQIVVWVISVLIRGSLTMKSGPLTIRQFGTSNFGTPKDPFLPEIDQQQETKSA